MVTSIIDAVVAEHAARADSMPWEILYTFPHVHKPLDELTRKRLEACLRFPTTPPAGKA